MPRFTESLASIPFSAVICRVAYRVVVRYYRAHPEVFLDPGRGLFLLSVALDRDGFPAVAMWITAFNYKMEKEGLTLREARDDVINRALEAERRRRGGRPWARVPKSCPRVTNRGAASVVADYAQLDEGDGVQ